MFLAAAEEKGSTNYYSCAADQAQQNAATQSKLAAQVEAYSSK
jgi:hypothetical protein